MVVDHPELSSMELCELCRRTPRDLDMVQEFNVGALIIRIGFWGFLIYNCSIISPKPCSNH